MTNPDGMPEERSRTVRQQLLDTLDNGPLSAAELSRLVRRSEKEIQEHLDELIKAGRIETLPPSCAGCGFRFDDRRKSKKPGKCPRCRSTRIRPPRFTLAE